MRQRIRAARIPLAQAGNLRLATWNVRELGKGPRLGESLAMIAAIIGAFDLVSIVEVRDDLRDLRAIEARLGSRWGIVFSDYVRDAGGNRERVSSAYDREWVSFTGLVSNAEGPRRRVGDEYVRQVPWWRPPFLAWFRAGRFDFILLAAHIRWSRTLDGRVGEIASLADWILARRRDLLRRARCADRGRLQWGLCGVGGFAGASGARVQGAAGARRRDGHGPRARQAV